MQDKWRDLIPFYVTDTLSDSDKKALETYLVECGAPCQGDIDEWRTIASATWQYVTVNSSDLPPLSQRVLQEAAKDAPFRTSSKIITSNEFQDDGNYTAPVYPRPSTEQKQRRFSRFPLTMVAAFMTMVIFGGILLSQLTPNDLEPQTLVQITNVVDITVEVTEQFGGQIGIQPTSPNSSGVLATPTSFAPQPTLTHTATPPPFPTRQPMTQPANTGGGLQTGACTIRNDTQGALTTYRNASFDADRAGIMRQGAQVNVDIVFGSWYQLSYGNWVSGDYVTVIGDCSQVWTATPTAIGDTNNGGGTVDNGSPNCRVRNDGSEAVNLYQWANANSPVNGFLNAGEDVGIYVGENGWYQVFYAQWVNGNDITLTGDDCGNLWIPTPTLNFNATPTPLPPPSSETVAVVTSTSAILQGSPAEIGMFVEQVTQGTNLTIIAHNDLTGSQRWYLVRSPQNKVGWVSSLDVDVIPNDVAVLPAATVPFIPSATPTQLPITPTLESWSHISTIVEHGCGGTVGEQATIALTIEHLGSVINITYLDSMATFQLSEIAPNNYSGVYGREAPVQVDLSFTSSTTYIANETINHTSGCIVRTTWAGTKQ